jgi:hypothetical protein
MNGWIFQDTASILHFLDLRENLIEFFLGHCGPIGPIHIACTPLLLHMRKHAKDVAMINSQYP